MDPIISQILTINNKHLVIHIGYFQQYIGNTNISKDIYDKIKTKLKKYNIQEKKETIYYYKNILFVNNNNKQFIKRSIIPFDFVDTNLRMFDYNDEKINEHQFPNINQYNNITNYEISTFSDKNININFIKDSKHELYHINISFNINKQNNKLIINSLKKLNNTISVELSLLNNKNMTK